MKANNIKTGNRIPLVGFCILIITGLYIINVWGCQPDNKKEVLKAYELRMQGKVDEALAHIDSLLAVDSTNALANFEKYRILGYMLTGGADIGMETDEIFKYVDKAALYDPDNVNLAYEKATASFLKAYITLVKGGGDPKEDIGIVIEDFNHVLELQPGHPQSLLYLVEIFSQLPPDMGGDMDKAIHYTTLFNENDEYYAAKAELLVNSRDELDFWIAYLETHNKTPELLEDIAASYIYEDDVVNAEKYYNEAIAMDPERNYLILNMARYYMYQVMRQEAAADSVLPVAAEYINMYLDSEPAPVVPMKAYALGMLVKTKMFTGQKEEGKKLLEEAKELDPYFSRASAIPSQSEFDPPDRIVPRYSSFFRPF